MATVISIASAKGGVSKTTLSVGIGTDLALEGYKVTIIDCDANKHALAFARKAAIEGFKVVGDGVSEETLLATIRAAKADSDIVLMDLPGITSKLVLMALTMSAFVLIPCQSSLLDVRDAIKTEAQVQDAAEITQREIARAVIWTRVPSGFESRVSKAVREVMDGRSLPQFDATLMERTAYREMFLNGEPPRVAAPSSPAASNLRAISTELLMRLTGVKATSRTEAA